MTQWQTQWDAFRKDHRTPLWLAGLFLLLLLWEMWSLITVFITTHQRTVVAKTQPTPVSLYPLENLHLFGVYAANLDSLPTTQLQLMLEGTIVVLNAPNLSRALIATPGAPATVYQTGDTLPGNATITRIAKHYVVINHNGALEKCALPIPTLSTHGE